TLSDSTPLNNSENEIIGIITNKISQVSTAEIAILITVILFIVGHVILIHREHSKLKQFYTVDTYAKKLVV
ncbi:MAG: hypothetical protein ACXVED_21085, partial [Bacteroidia bacterium]